MIDVDKKPFLAMAMSYAAKYRKEITKEEVGEFFYDMDGFTIEEVVDAFNKHRLDADRGPFWPRACDIIGQIIKAREKPAHEAWELIIANMANGTGFHDSDDPHALAALQFIGGWDNIAQIPFGYINSKTKPFVGAYLKSVVGGLPKAVRVVEVVREKDIPEGDREKVLRRVRADLKKLKATQSKFKAGSRRQYMSGKKSYCGHG